MEGRKGMWVYGLKAAFENLVLLFKRCYSKRFLRPKAANSIHKYNFMHHICEKNVIQPKVYESAQLQNIQIKVLKTTSFFNCASLGFLLHPNYKFIFATPFFSKQIF